MREDGTNKISIIILNWNGRDDTIACLESLANINYENFEVFLVDNASTDDSIPTFEKFKNDCSRFSITIIENKENLGFAKANNIGIRQAIDKGTDFVLILNNDTVAEPEFLNELIRFIENNPEYKVATPQIRYFDSKNIIWNCGGRISNYGTKKYYYEGMDISRLTAVGFIPVSFITGCAMLVNVEVFKKHGLLSEDFFFGEEDFEFSLRLKRNKIKSACILNSIIYHKVSASVSKASSNAPGKAFIHYLNRFINMKKIMSPLKWQLWRLAYLVYVMMLLKLKHKTGIRQIMRFSSTLLKESSRLNKVDKATFDKYFSLSFSEKPSN